MARKFLWIMATLIVLAIAVLFALRLWAAELAAIAFVPSAEFVEQEALAVNAYEDPMLWYSRPGMGPNDPARWQPLFRVEGTSPVDPEDVAQEELDPETGAPETGAPEIGAPEIGVPEVAVAEAREFAVFFIHPTSHLNRSSWNAKIGDAEAERMARIYVRGMASAFNEASEIWAPRYRQATLGAFLTQAPEAQQAIDAAYADVTQAFAFFIESIDPDTPIIIAGHSQGSLHALRLLREEIAGKPIEKRLIAAYAVGWPISLEHDLPQIGIPACQEADQLACMMSWISFAEPADPGSILDLYSTSLAYDGQMRGTGPVLCTNPLTGGAAGPATKDANLGTLVPTEDLSGGELVPASVPASCSERGLLLIGDPPDLGPYVLPGNNYHVYDILLFWANTKADAARRLDAWEQAR